MMIFLIKHKKTAYRLFILLLLQLLIIASTRAAKLPPPYGNNQFEGFTEGIQVDPLLGVVDIDAPPMNLGDPCPCTVAMGGPCPGHLIVDPFDADGLTCDNPSCPCGWYVEAEWIVGMFEGFPVLLPLDNELLVLLLLSFLYVVFLFLRKRKLLHPTCFSSKNAK